MEEKFVEEFTQDGRDFLYINLADIKSNAELIERIELIKPQVARHPEKSLYTITNIKNLEFNTESKEIGIQYLKHNKPHVENGVVIGMDGVKKIMAITVLKLSGRKDIHFSFSREQAVEWVLGQK